MILEKRKLNPLGFHLAALMADETMRYIILYGGSSSGKSYSVAQMILTVTMIEASSTLVMRKVGASIKDAIYTDFKTAAKQLGYLGQFEFKERLIVCSNGARIVFKGCDDSEKIKGISQFKRVVLDELSEFDKEDYNQICLRLRGQRGQQIISTFNPISETHWIKTDIFDTEEWHDMPNRVRINGVKVPLSYTKVKSIRKNGSKYMLNPRTGEVEEHAPDTVIVQTTYLNNFWVVGSPDGSYGFYDEQCIARFEKLRRDDPDYYNVYALGEWGIIHTGSEFFGSFNRGVHSQRVEYDASLPIHVSVDNNVLPYISVSYWQAHIGATTHIKQIGETIGKQPYNTVRKTGDLVAEYLQGLGYHDKVYLHGDASTRAANTIDEEKRSFLDLFIDRIKQHGYEVEDCVGKKNPSVPMSGEFINSIFEGAEDDLTITIGDECKTSIEDYMSVQKDVNGAILKTKVKNKLTGQSYEEHGHLSDTFRYVVCDLLRERFLAFSNRRKRNIYAREGAINFYNPNTECQYTCDVVYSMPNVNGKFCLVHVRRCGDKWHVANAKFRETVSTDEIRDDIVAINCANTFFECGNAYYPLVREMRQSIEQLKVRGEVADIQRRIAATSDFVRSNIEFSPTLMEEDEQYGAFVTNLLDYNTTENYEASAVLSGLVQVIVKSFL